MVKYSEEDRLKAEREIESLLRKGLTYHEAAQEVSGHSPIAFLSLRRMAYNIAVERGYFISGGLQHSTRSEHDDLLRRCKKKLESQGYTVHTEQNQIRQYVESKGSKGNPDLMAIKGKKVKLIEIVERTKTSATLVDQIERYSKVKGAEIVVVLPLDTRKTTVWGTEDLI